jgi:hypothetical protein
MYVANVTVNKFPLATVPHLQDGANVPEGNLPAQKRLRTHTDVDEDLLRSKSLLDAAADGVEGYVAAASEFLRNARPEYWAKNQKKLLGEWAVSFQHLRPAVVPFELDDLEYERNTAGENFPMHPWQAKLVEQLLEQPQARRLYFIEGAFSIGKSSLTKMLGDPRFWQRQQQPFRGCLNVTNVAKIDDFAMKYSKAKHPGVLVYDLPRHSQEFTPRQLNLLEEFTNTGNAMEGVKYEGSSVVMRSHVVVFSNHPPPAGILHKKVRHLKPQRALQPALELEWRMPGQQEDGTFSTAAFEQ